VEEKIGYGYLKTLKLQMIPELEEVVVNLISHCTIGVFFADV
jgi:hypothetical protein